MSSCGIVTGTKVLAVGSKGSAEDRSSTVLFDSTSTTRVSHVVTVSNCEALRLSTFSLPEGEHIKIHRVLVGGGNMPQSAGCACATEPAKAASVLASEPFKINCKPVVLDACNSVLFLTVPGSYVFELSNESMLGDVLAFAEPVECCCLPSGLIIGNEKSTNYVGTLEI